MGLDIRLPIGLMFGILGAMLAGFGLIDGDRSRALGLNVNLIWGACVAGFGLVMLAWWKFGARPAGDPRGPDEPRGGDPPAPRRGGH